MRRVKRLLCTDFSITRVIALGPQRNGDSVQQR